ncbi:hypothetical protein [Nocardioides flavescens]|uniref:Uncharacterized protein n=1 Tax=Nocardioides flavescens TaxID=2691959 RepID=A0A6L7EW22_9ACTN|nr:hypothetical protein [Nocardioides flavescens]MXG90900.1 hypothetical protein [Nocardioides flavescens]
MTETVSSDAATPLLDFMLIGSWWHVALDSDVGIARSAKRLAEEVTGRHDAFAQVRMELRQDVVRAARAARRAGGTDFWFARQLVPDLHLPVNLTVYWPEVERDSAVTDLDAETAAFADGIGRAGGGQVEVVALLEDWGVVRSRVVRRGEDTQAGAFDQLAVAYWLLPPDQGKVCMLEFGSPATAVADELVELFDVVVGSVSVRPAD